jgi:DNA-binding winged helix-turn-helix (wHTH) protein/Flp pilus assembly protein TadD/TolB-like protein
MQSPLGSSVRDTAASPNHSSGVPAGVVIYEFEIFRLDPANRLLTGSGKEVPLPGRAFDLLLLLVRRPGALLTKEELMDSIWSGSFVEESNLTVAISTLRRALNEDPHDRHYIQTVARRGYRFISEVREMQELPCTAKITSTSRSSPIAVETQDSLVPNAFDIDDRERDAVQPASAPQSFVPDGKPPSAGHQPQVRAWPLTVVAACLVGAMALGGWLLLRSREPIRTLAVLPFTVDSSFANGSAANLSPNELVLLGMTDGMISRLGGELVVRPTSSILRYSGTGPVSPVLAGHEQEADAVLTGLVQNSFGRTILKLRLIRVNDGLTLWQNSFRAGSNDLSLLEQNAGNAVASELQDLGAASAPSQVTSRSPYPGNATILHANEPAYQLYLRGRYFWNRRTVDGLRKSAEYFRQAIDADPNYAPAYAGLADSYALLASFSVEPGSLANADARSAALSAIHLDPTLAEPHASLGMIYFFTDWNLSAAEQEFERSIRLNPNYATAHHWYALDLAAMGRFPQALYEIHLAQKLDPLSLIIGTNVGWIEYLAHDFPAALRDLYRVLELDPNFARARTRLGMVEMATGDNRAAIANLTQALALSGDEDPWVEGLLGDAEARVGNRVAAEHALANVRMRSSSQYVPPTSRALILLGLGRKTEAMIALGQAIADHSTSMVYARVDPSLDPLRSDPSFEALLSQIKP